jgi:hypothetical protein
MAAAARAGADVTSLRHLDRSIFRHDLGPAGGRGGQQRHRQACADRNDEAQGPGGQQAAERQHRDRRDQSDQELEHAPQSTV